MIIHKAENNVCCRCCLPRCVSSHASFCNLTLKALFKQKRAKRKTLGLQSLGFFSCYWMKKIIKSDLIIPNETITISAICLLLGLSNQTPPFTDQSKSTERGTRAKVVVVWDPTTYIMIAYK